MMHFFWHGTNRFFSFSEKHLRFAHSLLIAEEHDRNANRNLKKRPQGKTCWVSLSSSLICPNRANIIDYSHAFNLVKYLAAETEYVVWDTVASSIAYVRDMMVQDSTLYPKFQVPHAKGHSVRKNEPIGEAVGR